MTGDDHNTDALIAALRSPALPAERAGEAAAVTAMLGVIARTPASTRLRASRGIAIAVVTVASLGVGGLAAAGPGVFHAAASKARSLVTADTADGESSAGAVTGDDPLGGSLPDGVAGDPGSLVALGAAASIQAGTSGGILCTDGGPAAQSGCGQSNNGSVPASGATPPPECADGNHGDAVAPVANASVPPSAEEDHGSAVIDAARDTCTPQGPQGDPQGPQGNAPGGTAPNTPTDQQGDGSSNGNPTPGTGDNGNPTPGAGNSGNPPVTTPTPGNGNATPPVTMPTPGNGNATPPVTLPTPGIGNANGQGTGEGTNNGRSQDTNGKADATGNAPIDSLPTNNGPGAENRTGNGG